MPNPGVERYKRRTVRGLPRFDPGTAFDSSRQRVVTLVINDKVIAGLIEAIG